MNVYNFILCLCCQKTVWQLPVFSTIGHGRNISMYDGMSSVWLLNGAGVLMNNAWQTSGFNIITIRYKFRLKSKCFACGSCLPFVKSGTNP